MKKFTPVLLICLLAASCNRGQVLRIDGRVENPAFEGSTAYIIGSSIPGHPEEDSSVIMNSTFSFTLPADSMAIKSIVIPAKGREGVQDLIFIAEPGYLDAAMSTRSHSTGPRLNSLLMEWKKDNFLYDSVQNELYYLAGNPGISREKYDSIMKLSARTDSAYMSRNIETMNQNLGNGIGLFFFKFYYDHLPAEVKKGVLEKTGDKFLKTDKQVWSKVMFDPEIPKETSGAR